MYSAKTHNTLRVGSSVIEEILEREVQKYEEELRRQERKAEERKAHEEKVSNVTITYNVVIDLPSVSCTNTSSTIASRKLHSRNVRRSCEMHAWLQQPDARPSLRNRHLPRRPVLYRGLDRHSVV